MLKSHSIIQGIPCLFVTCSLFVGVNSTSLYQPSFLGLYSLTSVLETRACMRTEYELERSKKETTFSARAKE